MTTFSPKFLTGLIGSIYDCAIDPARWPETLRRVLDALDCDKAILSLNDLKCGSAAIDRSVGWEPHWLEERKKHIPKIHARLKEWFSLTAPSDAPFVASRHIPHGDAETSPYIQQCLNPQHVVDIAHFFLMRDPAAFSELVVARHERQGVLTEREIALGGLLLPHLRRAVTIGNALDARSIETGRMRAALDALRCGMILTNEHAAVLHLNRAAERMMRNRDPVECVRGVLQAKHHPARREMKNAILRAARDEAAVGGEGIAIRLTTPDMPPAFAHVLPMTGSEMRARVQPDATVAVFIGSPSRAEDGAGPLRQAFGLTRAETRVVASLLAGRTLGQTAAALGIASSTINTHLDSVFAKTGVARQAELVRLAMQLAPPA